MARVVSISQRGPGFQTPPSRHYNGRRIQAPMKPASLGSRGGYAFGRFGLSADGTLLVRDGQPIPLAPKVLQTLLVLVERAGQVVRKSDLLTRIWPDSFVEETGLSRNVSLLRQALGDDAQTTIVTVARVGYRFAAPVVLIPEPMVNSDVVSPSSVAADGRSLATLAGTSGELRGEAEGTAPHGPQKPTRLLVLPFRQLREDPEMGFLAFSVPDAVTHALTGLTSLVVRSSAVASRFGGGPVEIEEISAKANVDAVLTGTVLRSGGEIRVAAELLSVPSGTVLWSASLQVPLQSVFDIQDKLVEHIVRSLSLSLTTREQQRIKNDIPASPIAYEFFLRGNESVGPQGISSSSNLRVARELYARSIEEDPRFAPAWVRLGRCHYLIGKSSENSEPSLRQAEACFQRALELSPDLPLAQSVYALFEIDQGLAMSAMVRLLTRALTGSAQPELYSALVQACRFCGLLEPAIVAHRRARELDPEIATGGYLAFWQIGDDESARRERHNLCWLVEALIVGVHGDVDRAIDILQDERGLTGIARHLVLSTRAVFEGRRSVALESATTIFDAFPDPEMVFFVTRNIAAFGELRALQEMERALERGFVLYRVLLREDPWLDPIRSAAKFQFLLDRSRGAYRRCREAYLEAGGERLLGPVPAPEELEPVSRASLFPTA